MRLNKQNIGQHPAKSGYIVDFFVADNNPVDFISGSGSYTVRFPDFFVSDVTFRGKETLFQTGANNSLRLSDMDILENSVQLVCTFSGDATVEVVDQETLERTNQLVTGGAIQNVKKVEVYTGKSDQFEPDIINFTNRIRTFNLTVNEKSPTAVLDIDGSDIQNKFDENIFYKVIPLDFLTSGSASEAVTGEMFSGFVEKPSLPFSPQITTSGDTLVNDVEVNVIGRSTARDLEIFRATDPIDIFTGVRIILESGIPRDFSADFRIRTNQEILISGSGIPLQKNVEDSVATLTTGKDGLASEVRVLPDQNLKEFSISALLDVNGVIEAFLLSD